MNRHGSIVGVVALAGVLACFSGQARAAANRQVEEANALYREGKFQEALDTYSRMLKENADSAELQFNAGAAQFQLGDLESARASFEQAGLLSDDPALQALSAYNMGNCSFQEAQAKLAEDPEHALASLNQSIHYYKDALQRNRELQPAAHNLETARRAIQQIQEQMAQREQEQQHQQEEMKEKLDELIQEQEGQNQQSRQASEQQQDPNQPDPEPQQMDNMAGQQQTTREKTEELSKEMESGSGDETPPNDAKQHAEDAAKKQQEAEEHLKNRDATQAHEAQEEALENLKQAREALESEGEPKEQQAGDTPQDGNPEGQNESPPESSDQSPQDGPPPAQPATAEETADVPPPDAEARDILNQEKRNKEERRIQNMIRVRPVEKDW